MRIFQFRRRADQDHSLQDYLDGVLDDRGREAFESRLASDPDLQQQLDELAAIKAMVASLEDFPVPRSFALGPELARLNVRPVVPLISRLAFTGAGIGIAVAVFATFRMPAEPDRTLPASAETSQLASDSAGAGPGATAMPPERAAGNTSRQATQAPAPSAVSGYDAGAESPAVAPNSSAPAGASPGQKSGDDFSDEPAANAAPAQRGGDDTAARLAQALGLGMAAILTAGGLVFWVRRRVPWS